LTREALAAVEASGALEATRRFEELFYYHVPFDELNANEETESVLTRIVGGTARVALIGPSGCGKSSVLSYVMGPLATVLPDAIVPLRIPVAAEGIEVVTEPGSLARHIVRYVTRWASRERFTVAEQEELERGIAETKSRAAGGTTRQFSLGTPGWVANLGVTHEVKSVGENYEEQASAVDAVEYLKRMVGVFSEHGLAPVFVFDDSDVWLSVPDSDRTEIANAFFANNVRMLAKEIPAGLVLAVHDQYLEIDGYKDARSLLSGELRVPRLSKPSAGIERLLEKRLEEIEMAGSLAEVILAEGIDRLARYYDSDAPIRDVLWVAQRALQHARSDGLDEIGPQLVEQAIAERSS
jgi:hypothetical protein